MADQRDSMIIYTAYADKFQTLTDEQMGRLFRLMIAYRRGADPEKLLEGVDPLVALSFNVVRFDLDEAARKYEDVATARSEAGKKGAEKRWAENGKNSKNSICHNSQSDDSKNADNDNDNDNDNDLVCVSHSLLETTTRQTRRARHTQPKPTREQVRAFVAQRKSSVNPDRFFDYYDAAEWIQDGKPVNWRQAVIAWEKTEKAPAIMEGSLRGDLDKLERMAAEDIKRAAGDG